MYGCEGLRESVSTSHVTHARDSVSLGDSVSCTRTCVCVRERVCPSDIWDLTHSCGIESVSLVHTVSVA